MENAATVLMILSVLIGLALLAGLAINSQSRHRRRREFAERTGLSYPDPATDDWPIRRIAGVYQGVPVALVFRSKWDLGAWNNRRLYTETSAVFSIRMPAGLTVQHGPRGRTIKTGIRRVDDELDIRAEDPDAVRPLFKNRTAADAILEFAAENPTAVVTDDGMGIRTQGAHSSDDILQKLLDHVVALARTIEQSMAWVPQSEESRDPSGASPKRWATVSGDQLGAEEVSGMLQERGGLEYADTTLAQLGVDYESLSDTERARADEMLHVDWCTPRRRRRHLRQMAGEQLRDASAEVRGWDRDPNLVQRLLRDAIDGQ